MTLLNDFFFILQQEPASSSVRAKITINQRHKIFEGHFPGMPVVPGVCMVQIVLEIMEIAVGNGVRLVAADTIKFLSVMNPKENNEFDVMIDYKTELQSFLVNANIFSGTVIFFKFKGALTFA
jgi:3-hydroxyacyl-[acyl-carrier-protein] dehydratase